MADTSYDRQLLHSGDGWELWMLAWEPRQASTIHDHGAATGFSTVLSGRLIEEHYAWIRGRLVLTQLRHRKAGDVDAFEPSTIHRVRAIDRSVTLHLYKPGYVEGRIYAEPRRPARETASGIVLATDAISDEAAS